MSRLIHLAAPVAAGAFVVGLLLPATNTLGRPADKPRKAFGLVKRVPWTTSAVRGSPGRPT